jgi:hypothetical protein
VVRRELNISAAAAAFSEAAWLFLEEEEGRGGASCFTVKERIKVLSPFSNTRKLTVPEHATSKPVLVIHSSSTSICSVSFCKNTADAARFSVARPSGVVKVAQTETEVSPVSCTVIFSSSVEMKSCFIASLQNMVSAPFPPWEIM